MTRNRRFFTLCLGMFAAVSAASWAHAKVTQEPDCSALTVGERYERELAKGETDCYLLHLQSGEFALVLAEQLSTWFPNNLLLRRVGQGLLLLPLLSLNGRAGAVTALRMTCFGAGEVAGIWGYHYEEYRLR